VEDCKLSRGHRVLILGAGPIGLMFVAVAHHLGCEVTVAGRRAVRLETAARLGAQNVIDVEAGDHLAERVRKAAPEAAYDVVIEAVGKPEVWEAAVQLVRKGGTINFFGGCPAGTTVNLDTALLHYSNLKLLASFHHTPQTIRRALEFIEAGIVHAGDFVSGETSLALLPALLKTMARGNEAVKTLVRADA
jgi:L-iditol 2-dehydrogenase